MKKNMHKTQTNTDMDSLASAAKQVGVPKQIGR